MWVPEPEIPSAFVLSQNYPNPFNPETSIEYSIPAPGEVTLVVYDVLGRAVSTLVKGVQSEGKHTIRFSAADLPSGIYAYRVEFIPRSGAGVAQSETKRMVLVR